MPSVIKHPQARRDLADLAYRIARRHFPASGNRFLALAEATFHNLADQPGLGGLWETANPTWAGLRVWPVRRFKNHLIFYRPTAEGIEVIRILHGARDLQSLFEAEGQ